MVSNRLFRPMSTLGCFPCEESLYPIDLGSFLAEATSPARGRKKVGSFFAWVLPLRGGFSTPSPSLRSATSPARGRKETPSTSGSLRAVHSRLAGSTWWRPRVQGSLGLFFFVGAAGLVAQTLDGTATTQRLVVSEDDREGVTSAAGQVHQRPTVVRRGGWVGGGVESRRLSPDRRRRPVRAVGPPPASQHVLRTEPRRPAPIRVVARCRGGQCWSRH